MRAARKPSSDNSRNWHESHPFFANCFFRPAPSAKLRIVDLVFRAILTVGNIVPVGGRHCNGHSMPFEELFAVSNPASICARESCGIEPLCDVQTQRVERLAIRFNVQNTLLFQRNCVHLSASVFNSCWRLSLASTSKYHQDMRIRIAMSSRDVEYQNGAISQKSKFNVSE